MHRVLKDFARSEVLSIISVESNELIQAHHANGNHSILLICLEYDVLFFNVLVFTEEVLWLYSQHYINKTSKSNTSPKMRPHERHCFDGLVSTRVNNNYTEIISAKFRSRRSTQNMQQLKTNHIALPH